MLLTLQRTPVDCMILATAVAQHAWAWSRDRYTVAATDENSVLSRPILQAMKVVHITYSLPKICLQHCPHRLQPIHDQCIMQHALLSHIQITEHTLQQENATT